MITAAQEKCKICGKQSQFTIHDKATLLRDARCKHCGAELRNSDVGRCISDKFGNNKVAASLSEILNELKDVWILNTSSTGAIHNQLKKLDTYIPSEYFDDIPSGMRKGGIRCVDLTNIQFENKSFDLVISEDVFEHIPNYRKAFREVNRVLTHGGYHIFTVPIHEGRKTVSREGNPHVVYHGDPLRSKGIKVCTDFGEDLCTLLEEFGFKTEIKICHKFFTPQEITDVDETYDEYLAKQSKMDEYFKYNSIVFVSEKIRDLA